MQDVQIVGLFNIAQQLHSNLMTTFPKDAFVFKVFRAAFIMVMVYMLINAISS